jgi:hypothetical protein
MDELEGGGEGRSERAKQGRVGESAFLLISEKKKQGRVGEKEFLYVVLDWMTYFFLLQPPYLSLLSAGRLVIEGGEKKEIFFTASLDDIWMSSPSSVLPLLGAGRPFTCP